MKVHVAIPPVSELYPFGHVCAGLRALGHDLVGNDRPLDADALVVWTPWHRSRREALFLNYKRAGKPCLVMENGWLSPLPNRNGTPCWQIAHDGWNGTGHYLAGGPERWRSWDIPPDPWTTRAAAQRTGYALVIGQRGHPYDPRTSTMDWLGKVGIPNCPDDLVLRRPRDCVAPLIKHLIGAAEVHVWTSNVGSLAVTCGIPVVQHGPNLMVENLASRPGEPLVRPDRTGRVRAPGLGTMDRTGNHDRRAL